MSTWSAIARRSTFHSNIVTGEAVFPHCHHLTRTHDIIVEMYQATPVPILGRLLACLPARGYATSKIGPTLAFPPPYQSTACPNHDLQVKARNLAFIFWREGTYFMQFHVEPPPRYRTDRLALEGVPTWVRKFLVHIELVCDRPTEISPISVLGYKVFRSGYVGGPG